MSIWEGLGLRRGGLFIDFGKEAFSLIRTRQSKSLGALLLLILLFQNLLRRVPRLAYVTKFQLYLVGDRGDKLRV